MAKCCICGEHYDQLDCMMNDRDFCDCGGGLVPDDHIDYGEVQD